MHSYIHKVQYYETDQMQVAHHSNYIRWMEEARTDYLDSVGISYAEMERRGIISPVLTVSCQYHTNEVMEVSDRILVMYDGKLYDAGEHGEKSETEIGLLMTGGGCA